MYIDGCEDIIKLTYDKVTYVKETGLYIVKDGNLVGLFDTYTGKLVVPTLFTGMTYQGPSLTFHNNGEIGKYALLYLKESGRTIELADGLQGTRVLGSFKLFISGSSRIIAVRRNNGTVALDVKRAFLKVPTNADKGWVACSIKAQDCKQYVLLNNGYVHSLESYLKEKYKEVYLIADEDNFESYMAIDNNLVATKLDSTGLMVSNLGKVVNMSKLRKLRRIV